MWFCSRCSGQQGFFNPEPSWGCAPGSGATCPCRTECHSKLLARCCDKGQMLFLVGEGHGGSSKGRNNPWRVWEEQGFLCLLLP